MPLRLHLHELHYNLGYVLHQQGDLPGAAQSYRQTLALDSNYASAHCGLGVILGEQGCWAEAIHYYQQAIALQPDYVEAYNNLGCALFKQGAVEQAVQVYQQAIALQPEEAILHNNLGQALSGHDPVAAIAAYRRAVALQPDLVLAQANLGKALQQQGQHLAAIDCFLQVTQFDPTHPSNYADCGVSWMAQGKLDQALLCFQAAIALQQPLVQAYCEWADQLVGQDELTQARVACSRFLQALQSSNSEVYLHLGQTYLHLGNVLTAYGGAGQYRQAETHYQRALQLQPENLDLYLKLADCLVKQGRTNAALWVYQLALTLHPHHPGIYAQLGYVLEQQQRLEEAIDCYRTALNSSLMYWKEQESDKKASSLLPSDCLDSNPMLPHFVVSSCGLNNLPRGFHRSTLDWMTATKLDGSYIALEADPTALEIQVKNCSVLCPVPAPAAMQPPSDHSCGGLNCTSCLKQIFNWFQPIHLGKQVYTCAAREQIPVQAPPLFVATVPAGKVWVAPQQNAWMVSNAIAILTSEHDLLADVSRDYPGQLPGCQHFDPKQHQIFDQDKLPSPELIEGSVAVLAGLSGHNYFHWMVDILPRLELLRQSGKDLAAIDWFLINNDQLSFQRDTLNKLGIPAAKILQSDRHSYIQAEHLIVPAFPGHLGWLEPWALAFLRREFLPLGKGISSPERVYISRANAHHRRMLNEAAVLEQLLPLGFVSVELETMPLAEQVSLFANARVIIAPHGGGLTNILFCRPNTTIIELMSPSYVRHYYWVISQLLGLHHYFVSGETLDCYPVRQLMYPSPLTEDIWINLDSLQAVLQRVGPSRNFGMA